jgi:hypothetical protein
MFKNKSSIKILNKMTNLSKIINKTIFWIKKSKIYRKISKTNNNNNNNKKKTLIIKIWKTIIMERRKKLMLKKE